MGRAQSQEKGEEKGGWGAKTHLLGFPLFSYDY